MLYRNGLKASHLFRNGQYIKQVVVNSDSALFYDPLVTNGKLITTSKEIHSNSSDTVNYANVYTDTWIRSGGTLTVSSGGTALKTRTFSGGHLIVLSGGSSTNWLYTSSGVSLGWRYGGAIVNSDDLWLDTKVAYGCFHILKSGVASNTEVYSTGFMKIAGGAADGVQVEGGGRVEVTSYGLLSSATVKVGGTLTVISDRATTGIKLLGGYVLIFPGAHVSFSRSIVSNKTIGGLLLYNRQRSATIHRNTSMYNIVISSSGNLTVYAGGFLSGATIYSSGHLFVSSRGILSNVNISGGVLKVHAGGSCADVHLNAVVLHVYSNVTISNIETKAGTVLYVSSGGTALNVTSGAMSKITVLDGGVITYAL